MPTQRAANLGRLASFGERVVRLSLSSYNRQIIIKNGTSSAGSDAVMVSESLTIAG